jgi:hypothetical protein
MGVLWYIAAMLVWWVVSGFLAGGIQPYSTLKDFEFGVAAAIFWFIPFWLPYITWMALGELILFRRYPNRRTPFVTFAVISLVIFTALSQAFFHQLRLMVVWPAVIVTVMYFVRRNARPAQHGMHQQSLAQDDQGST